MSHCCTRAPHRLCAPSPVRLSLAFFTLMFVLLLCPVARAGSYSLTYSGGSFTYDNGGSPVPYRYSPDGSYGPGGYPGSIADCSGEITATFTWEPDPHLPSDPAPTAVIAVQTGNAYFGTSGATKGSAFCADGLNHAEQDTVMGTGQNASWRGVSSGTVYSAQATDASGGVVIKCSPRSNRGTGGECSLNYSVRVYPVTINLTGTTPDSNSGLNVLTGGQVTATLNCPFPITSYSWSVSGATAPNPFLTWDPTFPNSNYPTQFVALTSTDKTKDSFSFYDAHNGDSVTVQCTVTVQPPSGPALTVTAMSPNITYIKPSVNWVTNQPYGSRPFGFFDGLPNGPFGAQELWGPITITEPPLFVTSGNSNSVGLGVVVQIANPSRSNTRVPLNGKPATYSKISVVYANGATGAISSPVGLDGDFPYPYGAYKNTDGTFTNDLGNYGWLAYNDGYSGDMPQQPYRNSDQDGGGNAWNASSASDSFDTWVMYRPASVGGQGTIYVPLQKLSWSWGATASLDQYNLWGVNQPQVFVSGPPANTDIYPAWGLKIPLGPNVGP